MLNRRDALKITAGLLLSSDASKLLASTPVIHSGWLGPKAVRQSLHLPRNSIAKFPQLHGTGNSKQVLLWKFLEHHEGPFQPYHQEHGDCVGQAAGLGATTLSAVQAYHRANEEFRGHFSTEVAYAGSRIEVGGVRRGTGGSLCIWASEFLNRWGAVLRGKYGPYDITNYNVDLAIEWGRGGGDGVPADLERIAKDRPVKAFAQVNSWDAACDAIANGYPILIGSNQGFETTTDSEGFLAPSGFWNHAMLLWGCDTLSSRQGGCIANSWGTQWINARQHKLGTPSGCFWADAYVIDRMLKQGDSYALSNFHGFPTQVIDYFLL